MFVGKTEFRKSERVGKRGAIRGPLGKEDRHMLMKRSDEKTLAKQGKV